MTKQNVKAETAKLPPPCEDERAAIDRAASALRAREPRFAIDFKQKDDGAVDLFGGKHDDHHGWRVRLENAFGSRGDNFAINQLNHIMSLCRESDGKISVIAVNAMLSMIEAAKPQDEMQAALAVQMAMMHALTTQAIRRAGKAEQLPQYDSAAGMAVKLARTFTMQAEALAKMQRGGEQVVKVVHVHSGGQAVIGNVTTPGTRSAAATGANGPGGGGSDESSNQPHAKGQLPAPSAQPMPEMRCEDPERAVVPIARRRR